MCRQHAFCDILYYLVTYQLFAIYIRISKTASVRILKLLLFVLELDE
jgi:hypothetical protein